MDYENDGQGYDDEPRNYRERSRSPREDDGHANGDGRARSASPGGRGERVDSRGPPAPPAIPEEDEEQARNTGTNLFVTGIAPRLSEEDVTRMFEKYGEVEKCNIMRDPHSRESRGFGFVNMVSSQQADAAKEGLQGEVYEGRTLSIEKARRSRPRTPTPGRYFGPPKKRDDVRGPPRGGRFGDRPDDRRGGYGRRDDFGSRGRFGGDRYGDRYNDRYGDRPSHGRRERYDDRPPSDRYGSREDRHGSGSRRGGDDYHDRGFAGGRPAADPYAEPAGAGGGGRYYDDRAADDRYSRR